MSQPAEDPEKRLTNERYAEFVEAVDVLYIKNNISGRNKFTETWPDAAQYIFGEELMRFDREGTTDRERRTALEDEAETRRLEMFEILSTLEVKSVDKGALQIEYVQGLVTRLGRKLSLTFYSRWLVDRFIPPSPEEVESETAEVENAKGDAGPRDASSASMSDEPPMDIPEDPMDRIRPISVDPEMSPPPETPQESPPEQPREQSPPPPSPSPASPPAQQQPSPSMPVFDDEDDDPPLFVAGQIPEPPKPAAPQEEEIIVETQGQKSENFGAQQQESMAPVVGGQKKPGLKIMSISDNDTDPEKDPGNQ